MMPPDAFRVLYFGCIGDSGHYLWRGEYDRCRSVDSTPWGLQIDGGLSPKGQQAEGAALLHHKDGWTALAFWDRSVDNRPGSNSVFLAANEMTFDQIVALSREKFPKVWKRFSFPVAEVAHAS